MDLPLFPHVRNRGSPKSNRKGCPSSSGPLKPDAITEAEKEAQNELRQRRKNKYISFVALGGFSKDPLPPAALRTAFLFVSGVCLLRLLWLLPYSFESHYFIIKSISVGGHLGERMDSFLSSSLVACQD